MSTAQDDDRSTVPGISRRSVLAAGAIGIPGVALVACSPAKAPADEAASGSSSPTGPGSKAVVAKLSDIPVGEAISATGPDGGKIILVRPTATTVAAYSAICTHQGCIVEPAGKELDCPCHGSVFDLKGAVLNGPAQRPLRQISVSVSGQDVVAG
jgi:Rieske Fe-S protein